MRIMAVIIILFVALLGFGTFNYYYFDHTAGKLLQAAETAEKKAEAGEWDQAEEQLHRLRSSWEKANGKWTILIDHEELDKINITMSRAMKYMETRDVSGLMAELAELKLLLRHIPEKEALNLKNVL
ncbi:MAG: hypothetical protein CVU89_10640 [Firmicutes bacterium HGW-Firmicutes-14]|nr:MAG: hypothetical protein CVU89_10640 [Firmicutes bacterium HGW-Firmicutes-14]